MAQQDLSLPGSWTAVDGESHSAAANAVIAPPPEAHQFAQLCLVCGKPALPKMLLCSEACHNRADQLQQQMQVQQAYNLTQMQHHQQQMLGLQNLQFMAQQQLPPSLEVTSPS